MAKFTSLITFSGKIGNVVGNKNGTIGFNNPISKTRINSDPKFARTRENMREFGAAGMIGGALRKGIIGHVRKYHDQTATARMQQRLRSIISAGLGNRGVRPFQLQPNKYEIEGFEFNQKDKFASIFSAPYTLSAATARDAATLDIPDFNTADNLTIPQGATHVRVALTVVALSDYQFDPSRNAYQALEPDLVAKTDTAWSSYIPLPGMVGAATTLTATLPGSPTMTNDVGLVTLLTVQFYQEVNSIYNLLHDGNALKIAEIF